MRIIIGCEYSQVVCKAFRDKGHEAYSCDILPTDGNPEWHYQDDIIKVLKMRMWHMGIFHPPCTYLCNSGVSHLYKDEDRWEKMEDGARFFKALLDSKIPKIAIENPIMHRHAKEIIGVTQSQVIQPWMFGHMEQKATCLWLKNLPLLIPENDVREEMKKLSKKEQQRIHYLPPSKDRWKIRSTTYTGIAAAMANQWG